MPRIVFQGFVGFHEGSPIHEGLLSFKTHPSLATLAQITVCSILCTSMAPKSRESADWGKSPTTKTQFLGTISISFFRSLKSRSPAKPTILENSKSSPDPRIRRFHLL
ncbi:hypothetical protein L596_016598 [Steinernema carpocapsae]|uniref:Uncharacterized protein n=1 Tax=Steinernema carpocapsae TaxID=34508 RepID=A0A4U5NIF6_STECR|nr:hypothetical protein L596_016598 [Steinernema carpocapsae]